MYNKTDIYNVQYKYKGACWISKLYTFILYDGKSVLPFDE